MKLRTILLSSAITSVNCTSLRGGSRAGFGRQSNLGVGEGGLGSLGECVDKRPRGFAMGPDEGVPCDGLVVELKTLTDYWFPSWSFSHNSH